jgi:hypothetical protein
MELTRLELPQVLNDQQTARVLSVSIGALRRWRRELRGPEFIRLERCVRYSVGALERFLTENSVGNKGCRFAVGSPSGGA